ncbi:Uma2 family endonuclease [Streptomyces sp. NPDC003077]|uniref:Uma2 family endonuclease n=1 Tax=Streptomyces sp. NPDC003077 TaxID=3154443 RepID=UPI0033BD70F1
MTSPAEPPGNGVRSYRDLRDDVIRIRENVPGKLEISNGVIVHDPAAPNGLHELTAARISRRLEKVMPEGLLAHTGTAPDVEDVLQGVLRHPDVTVIAEADMAADGPLDPRALIAAIEVVSRSNPGNDWVGKIRDYPLLGVPVYAIFDLRTGSGAVLSDIRPTPSGPRYAMRKDFVYGEDVTIAEWTIPTGGLPRYS